MVESLKSSVQGARSEGDGIASQVLNHLSHPALMVYALFGQYMCILGEVISFFQMSFVRGSHIYFWSASFRSVPHDPSNAPLGKKYLRHALPPCSKEYCLNRKWMLCNSIHIWFFRKDKAEDSYYLVVLSSSPKKTAKPLLEQYNTRTLPSSLE
ncbi:hypothetical protein VNO77_22916 [Canavalia gladiata]|uniref:Uncharacterized protein n=1 Tax=Canavalia gladiata TaxID=3824 RepID=A0AAN9L6X4_CANGL